MNCFIFVTHYFGVLGHTREDITMPFIAVRRLKMKFYKNTEIYSRKELSESIRKDNLHQTHRLFTTPNPS